MKRKWKKVQVVGGGWMGSASLPVFKEVTAFQKVMQLDLCTFVATTKIPEHMWVEKEKPVKRVRITVEVEE